MKFHRARRTTAVRAILAVGLALIAVAAPLSGVASAATPPVISVDWTNWGQVTGSGFTPGSQVTVQEWWPDEQYYSSATTTAAHEKISCTHPPGEPPDCFVVTPAGYIAVTPSAPWASLNCAWPYPVTITATDSTGNTATLQTTFTGMC